MIDTECAKQIKTALSDWARRANTPMIDVKQSVESLANVASACDDERSSLSLKLIAFML